MMLELIIYVLLVVAFIVFIIFMERGSLRFPSVESYTPSPSHIVRDEVERKELEAAKDRYAVGGIDLESFEERVQEILTSPIGRCQVYTQRPKAYVPRWH